MHEVVTSSTPLSPEENIPQKPKRLKHARLKKLGNKRVPKNDKPISNKPASLTSGSKTRNPQDTLEKVKKVDQLGQQKKMTLENACKQVGISAGYYYKLRSK